MEDGAFNIGYKNFIIKHACTCIHRPYLSYIYEIIVDCKNRMIL